MLAATVEWLMSADDSAMISCSNNCAAGDTAFAGGAAGASLRGDIGGALNGAVECLSWI